MAKELKGGFITEDPRLDRIPKFDERSRNFPIRTVLSEEEPLRSFGWYCPAWLDQGQEGACVGFAWAHELAAWPAGIKGLSNKYAQEQLYWEAQKIDEWEGGSYPGASPRYDGTSVLAGAKVIQNLGFMDEYRWSFGIEETLRTIGYHGPVVIGVNWHEGMFEPDEHGLIHPTGSVMGGHAVLVRGVALRARLPKKKGTHSVVRIRNSWGADWGVNGDCWMLVEEFEALLKERGEVCVPVMRQRQPLPDTDMLQQILEDEHYTVPVDKDAEPADADHQVDQKGRGSSAQQEFDDFLQLVAAGEQEVWPEGQTSVTERREMRQALVEHEKANGEKEGLLGSTLTSSTLLITRREWGARPPRSISTDIKPRGVGLHYQGPKLGTFPHSRCFHIVRAIQDFHMRPKSQGGREWADIAYNGLPCPHGYVFEGRGTRRRSAANGTNEANLYYYALCGLLGEGDPLTEGMKTAFNSGISWLRTSGGSGNEVRNHGYWRSTACAGPAVRGWMADGRPEGGGSTPSPSGQRTLQYGMRGADVKEWQQKLIEYFRGENPLPQYGADSDFGDETVAYTREFQKREGIPTSGMVGSGDRARMAYVLKSREGDDEEVKQEDIDAIADAVFKQISDKGLAPRTKQDIAERTAQLIAEQGLTVSTKESIAETVWRKQPSS